MRRAWFSSFATPREYRFSHVGLERDLERWLVHHPDRLVDLGYAVRLRHQQLVLPDRRRPDLVFDLVEDGDVGTLVVELKAGPGTRAAVDQVVGYRDALAVAAPAGAPTRALLVAYGFSPGVRAYAGAWTWNS